MWFQNNSSPPDHAAHKRVSLTFIAELGFENVQRQWEYFHHKSHFRSIETKEKERKKTFPPVFFLQGLAWALPNKAKYSIPYPSLKIAALPCLFTFWCLLKQHINLLFVIKFDVFELLQTLLQDWLYKVVFLPPVSLGCCCVPIWDIRLKKHEAHLTFRNKRITFSYTVYVQWCLKSNN